MGSGRVYILRRPNPAAPRADRAARRSEGAAAPITAAARNRGARQPQSSWWAGSNETWRPWVTGARSIRKAARQAAANQGRACAGLLRRKPSAAPPPAQPWRQRMRTKAPSLSGSAPTLASPPVTHVARPAPPRSGACANAPAPLGQGRARAPAQRPWAEGLPGATAAGEACGRAVAPPLWPPAHRGARRSLPLVQPPAMSGPRSPVAHASCLAASRAALPRSPRSCNAKLRP